MEEEIKDGEYIRTKQGTIAKIEDSEFDIRFIMPDGKITYRNWKEDFGGAYVSYEEITKHSPNIIDLIEEGDFVNGCIISMINEIDDEHPERIVWYCEIYDVDIPFRNDDIKTIVTKEQFENLEYKVEE